MAADAALALYNGRIIEGTEKEFLVVVEGGMDGFRRTFSRTGSVALVFVYFLFASLFT